MKTAGCDRSDLLPSFTPSPHYQSLEITFSLIMPNAISPRLLIGGRQRGRRRKYSTANSTAVVHQKDARSFSRLWDREKRGFIFWHSLAQGKSPDHPFFLGGLKNQQNTVRFTHIAVCLKRECYNFIKRKGNPPVRLKGTPSPVQLPAASCTSSPRP